MFRLIRRCLLVRTVPARARILPTLLSIVGLQAVSTHSATFGLVPSSLPKVQDSRLDSALARTWRGIVSNNIAPWTDGLVHRPNSETPGDAVSEGQAYGMIVALYAGDQARFNSIWDASEKLLWNSTTGFYDWRYNKGAITGSGMATDADQDIALMLLFADSLVKKGIWTTHTSPKLATYRSRALEMINTLWSSAVTGKYNFAPGAGWGGDGFVNPGYFSPATYRIFGMVDRSHDWNAVVDQCYAVLARSPGASKGMVPDWMIPDGNFFDGDLGYNAYRSGHTLYKDAIRVHWRLALDWLWFGDARARKFLDSAAAFVKTPDRANFYDLEGVLAPATDTFRLGSGLLRSRRESSELTVGMWACAAFAAHGPDSVQAWVDTLLGFLPQGAESWGRPSDASRPDIDGSTPNEQYFEQFLGWFGTAVLAGRFSNVFDDLDDPNPALPLAWSKKPSSTPIDLDLQEGPLSISALLNKPANWTISINSYPAGQVWSTSGRSDSIAATWNGFDLDGKPFPQGWCQVHVSPRGLADEWQWVWLGHHRNIRTGTDWVIIDDFTPSSLSPNLGGWGTFNNSSAGGTAKVGPLDVSGSGTARALSYTYDLGANGYQFCGLAWNSNGWSGLGATTKVRYSAKADHKTVMDLYLVQSDITDDNYFHILDTVTTSWKTFEHAYSSFTGRLASRSGSPNPSKGTGFHWHVQADKCLDATKCVTGTISLDDIHVGGNIAQMITAPAARLAMPADVPYTGVVPKATRGPSSLQLRSASREFVELSAPAGTEVRWIAVSGRDLGRSVADARGIVGWRTPGQACGVVFAVPVLGGKSLTVLLH